MKEDPHPMDDMEIPFLRAILNEAMPLMGQKILDETEGMEETEFSDDYYEKLGKLLDQVKQQEKEKKRSIPRRAVAGMLILALLVIPFTIDASRNAIFFVIREFSNNWQFLSLEDLPAASFREAPIYGNPSYKPEGFVEHKESEQMLRYLHEDGRYIFFTISPISSYSPAFDKEDYIIEEVQFDGYSMWVMRSQVEDKGNMVIWRTDKNMYSIYGYISADELLKMAESTREE